MNVVNSAQWESPTESAQHEEPPWTAPLPHLERRTKRYLDVGLVKRHRYVEVRQVRDRLLGRTLVQKRVWRPAAPRAVWARLIAEGQVTAQLDYPSVVPIYDLAEGDDGRPFFTMPLVQGQHLGTWMGRLGRGIPAGRGPDFVRRRQLGGAVIAWLVSLCQTLGYAHDRGVSHGDVKPEHVRITPHGEIRLLDWGLARTWSVALQPVVSLTHGGPGALAGQGSGTPPYRAPELCRQSTASPLGNPGAADVFAVGILAGQVVTTLKLGPLPIDVRDATREEPSDRPGIRALGRPWGSSGGEANRHFSRKRNHTSVFASRSPSPLADRLDHRTLESSRARQHS